MKRLSIPIFLLCLVPACRSGGDAGDTHPAQAPAQDTPAAESSVSKTAAIPAMPVMPAAKPADAEPAAPLVPGTRAERFAAIKDEHDAAMNAYYDLYRNAKTDEERQKIAETTKPPDVSGYAARVKALVDEDPKDETAFLALSWQLREMSDETVVTLLDKYHFEREGMGDLLRALDYAGPAGQSLVERLAEKSPHSSVRGRALFSLAERYMEDQRLATELKGMSDAEKEETKRYVEPARFERLSKADPASFEKPALDLLRRVDMEYGSIKTHPGTEFESTLGATASACIFEIQNLAVGKVAPDIAGEDVDGVAFKLSEYRGKAVMLDFWGFW